MPNQSREWDSSAYHRISAPQFSWGMTVLGRVALRGEETVLDAGCGTGRLTAELLERLPRGQVVAMDLSRNMLVTASASLSPRFSERVRFVAANLLRLPFNEAFDGIFSTAAFHWVSDHAELFRSLFDALRPGGWLIAQCGGGPNLQRLLARVSVLSQTGKYAPYLADYRHGWEYSDAETAAQRLHAAGFVQVETSLQEAKTRLDDASQYGEFVSKVILHRHLERIPDPDVQQDFLDDLTQRAARDDPPFELDYWRLNLSARREEWALGFERPVGLGDTPGDVIPLCGVGALAREPRRSPALSPAGIARALLATREPKAKLHKHLFPETFPLGLGSYQRPR